MAVSEQRAASGSGLILLTLASGQFLMTLDSSVMNVSIATVAKDVGTTVTGIQTAITLYTLVMASLMITGGKIGQILGRKRAFAIGCVIYGCGSFTTAISPSLPVLMIGWSLLEGVGAALILPAIVALVASNFRRRERPRAYGLVASAGAIAVAAGPLIGGLFTTYLSWRWVFVGEVLIVLAILVLGPADRRRAAGHAARLDLVGTVLSAARPRPDRVRHPHARASWGFVQPKPDAPTWLGLSPVIWLIARRRRRCCGSSSPGRTGGSSAAPSRSSTLDPAQPHAARRAHGVLLPVPAPGRAVLRRAAVPLGRARAVRDRHRRPPAAAVDHAAARRGRHPQGVPQRVAAPRRTARLPVAVRRHRRAWSPHSTPAPAPRSSPWPHAPRRASASARSPRSSAA